MQQNQKLNRKGRKENLAKVAKKTLHLKDVAFAGDQFVQHRVHEKADEEPGDQPGHYDDSERLLGVRTDAGRQGRRQQSETGHQGGHHDGPKSKE